MPNYLNRLSKVTSQNNIVVLQSEVDSFKRKIASMMGLGNVDEVLTYSQSCTFHIDNANNLIVITSGALITTTLTDEAQRDLKKYHSVSPNNLKEIRKSVWLNLLVESLDDEGLDEYLPLKIVGLGSDPQAKKYVNLLGQEEEITTILYCELESDRPYRSYRGVSYSRVRPYQGQQVKTMSSPFGILSSELYKNCLRQAGVIKVIGSSLLLLDMIANMGQEGGGVYDQAFHFLAMLLPKFQLGGHNNIYYGLALTWETIHSVYRRSTQSTRAFIDTALPLPYDKIATAPASCLILANKKASGTIISHQNDVLVLTVKHFLSEDDRSIQVRVQNVGVFRAEVHRQNTSNLDYILLRITDPSPLLWRVAIPLKNIIDEVREFQQGDEVFTVGYGLINLDDEPLISRGRISKLIVRDKLIVLIQTDCFMHNGYSGGGVYNSEWKLIGFQSYNISSSQLGILCDMNFIYPITLLLPLLTSEDLNGSDFPSPQINDFIANLHKLQTRFHVPDLRPKL